MVALNPMAAAYLMQAVQGVPGAIPPAPPCYPPNTQPLAMDSVEPMSAAPVSQEVPVEDEIVAKGLDKIQHKGLFGVKGTLRDVLGLVGDSYLMVNGRNPYYAPIRRQEMASAEMAGRYQNNEEENFINNPLLAIQRLAESGYGEQAQSLYQDYTKNQAASAAQAQAAAQLGRQELRDAQLAKQGDVRADKDLQEILGRTYASIKDPAILAQFNEWVGKKIQELPESSVLRGMPLPRNVDEAGRYGIQPYQQERLEDFDRGLGIQQQNANTNTATSRPRSDTPVELFERYSRIPADRRTPEQQAFITKYTSTGKRTGRRTGGSGGEGLPPRPGTYKGQTATSPSGTKFSWDGKSWKQQ